MKTTILLAIILIALGVTAFGYQAITYTTKEKIVDVGPLEITAEKTRTIPLPPVVGAVALVSGVAFLFMGLKKS